MLCLEYCGRNRTSCHINDEQCSTGGGTIARCVPGDVREIVQFVVVFALRHITINFNVLENKRKGVCIVVVTGSCCPFLRSIQTHHVYESGEFAA